MLRYREQCCGGRSPSRAPHGATVAAAGALLVLGTDGAAYFAEQGIAVEAVARDEYPLWMPEACPLCASGVPLEDVNAPAA
jgi:hypothetical protein